MKFLKINCIINWVIIMEDVFQKAVVFAVNAHSGMTRKSTSLPYILHPMEAAVIVATMTEDREVLASAVLHDTVEDTKVTMEDILENFGPRVAYFVQSETENKRKDLPAEKTWELRKRESLETLRNTDDIFVKMLWLGDKLSNLRAIKRDFDREGQRVFDRFHQKDPGKQAWYYLHIAALLSDLKDYPAYKEYNALAHEVFDRFVASRPVMRETI